MARIPHGFVRRVDPLGAAAGVSGALRALPTMLAHVDVSAAPTRTFGPVTAAAHLPTPAGGTDGPHTNTVDQPVFMGDGTPDPGRALSFRLLRNKQGIRTSPLPAICPARVRAPPPFRNDAVHDGLAGVPRGPADHTHHNGERLQLPGAIHFRAFDRWRPRHLPLRGA